MRAGFPARSQKTLHMGDLIMNLPNQLTLFRVLLAPIFLVLLVHQHFLPALIVFMLASLTDYFDGMLARKHKLVTSFGKFLDPLADKILTTMAFLGFIHLELGYEIVFVAAIILIREFVVTGIRLVAQGSGTVIAAGVLGKIKTISQMVAIIAVVAVEYSLMTGWLVEFESGLRITYSILLWISAAFALISGIEYAISNRKFINTRK